MGTLLETTVEALRDLVAQSTTPDLPSASSLARRVGVSYSTMHRALCRLRDQGVVSFAQGSKVRIVGARTGSEPVEASSADRLYDALSEALLTGTIRTGEPMPKAAYLTARFRVSSRTVAQTYARMLRESLVHRQGRRYVAGAAVPAAGSSDRSRSRPVILVVTDERGQWGRECRNALTGPFGVSFTTHAEMAGVQLVEVPWGPGGPKPGGRSVPGGGAREVISTARGLGMRLRGTIFSLRRVPSTAELRWMLRAVAGPDRPAVVYDRKDACFEAVEGLQHVVRCLVVKRDVVRCAVEALREHGHTKAYFCYQADGGWQEERAQLLEEQCELRGIELTTRKSYGREAWEEFSDPALQEEVRRLYRSEAPALREAFKHFGRIEPRLRMELPGDHGTALPTERPLAGLVRYVRDVGFAGQGIWRGTAPVLTVILAAVSHLGVVEGGLATVDIAPNDSFGRARLRGFERLGIRVPEDISVLSFDNRFPYAALPLSTVDFGYGNLGYQAFHAIWGDLDIPRDAHGAIRAKPFLVDRGSLAPKAAQPARGNRLFPVG